MTLKQQNSLKTTVYSPERAFAHPLEIYATIFKDIWQFRELALRLAIRDISAKYRQTALGIFWMFVSPLISAFIWMFLNGSGIISVSETDVPYPIFVLVGTLVWSIFTESVNSPLTQMRSSKTILSKINFPKEALVLSGILQTIFNVVIRIAFTLILVIILGVRPGWQLLLFPFALLSLMLTGTVIGLLLTPVGTLYTDMTQFISLFFRLFVYVTPVMFPIPEGGVGALVFQLNPMTPIVMTARSWMIGAPTDFLTQFLILNGVVVVLLAFALVIFRVSMPILIERMNA